MTNVVTMNSSPRKTPIARLAVIAASVALAATGAVASAAATDPFQADADDPAVTSLAAEQRIPIAEAQRRIGWQNPAAQLEQVLTTSMGEQFGGLWIDEAGGGRVKVGFVGDRLDDGGAIARLGLEGVTDAVPVAHSLPELERASEWLGSAMPSANEGAGARLTSVVLTDRNVVELRLPEGQALTDQQRRVVDEAQRQFGSLVALGSWEGRVEDDACAFVKLRHTCDAPLRAGVALYSGTTPVCSTGFTARSVFDNKWYVMTAGHCGPRGTQFRAFQPKTGLHHVVGDVRTSIDPGTSDDDMAIVEIENVDGWNPKPWVYVKDGAGEGVPGAHKDEDYAINGTSWNPVGSRICMSAAVTGTSCGKVLGHNFDGVKGGRVQASYCRHKGDSGGAVFVNHLARGLHSGSASSATCGAALFQPIIEAADKLNVNVATS